MNDESIRAALYRSLATGRRVDRDPRHGGVRFVEGTRSVFATDDQLERVLDEIGRIRTIIESSAPPTGDGLGLG